MTSYVSAELRRLVEARAQHSCEYCLLHDTDTFLGCQVDHVISEKHGGATESANLAYACTLCNRAKGTDIGSIALTNQQFTRFYNPRTDHWGDHFVLQGDVIDTCSPIGEVTARLLGFNETERIREREVLRLIGRYPPDEAMGRIS